MNQHSDTALADLRLDLKVRSGGRECAVTTQLELHDASAAPVQLGMAHPLALAVDGLPAQPGDLARLQAAGARRFGATEVVEASTAGPWRCVTDPADGRRYGLWFNFFDPRPQGMVSLGQPEERVSVHVRVEVPDEWTVISHTRAVVRDGVHRFPPVEVPPNTLLLVAGRWQHVGCDEQTGEVPIDLWAPASQRGPVDVLLGDARRALRAYREELGLGYPLDSCQIVLVPDLPLLGCCVQGLLLLDAGAVPRLLEDRVFRASVLTHELGHTWIGSRLGFASPGQDGPSELVEGLNTYLARTALAAQLLDIDPWDPSVDTPDQGLYGDWAQTYRDHARRLGASELHRRLRELIEKASTRTTKTELLDRLA